MVRLKAAARRFLGVMSSIGMDVWFTRSQNSRPYSQGGLCAQSVCHTCGTVGARSSCWAQLLHRNPSMLRR